MFRPAALVFAGAVLAAGAAHAQEAAAPRLTVPTTESAGTGTPWYQRFTTSNGVTESITGETENDRSLPPAWTMNQRWGVTLDIREATRIDRLPEGGRGDQTSVGAYYQFTPRMRVGGEVSLEVQRPGATTLPDRQQDEPRAGVRVESAFRF
ncbi:MAG TPA: hypothetical protein PLK37_07455 [Terricaulis sp.]|nr:hypothetical protein [Terricaulis sp.]